MALASRVAQASWGRDLRRHWSLYLMALPAITGIIVFGYGPLFGISVAFLDYSPVRGIIGSSWVGMSNFAEAFRNPFFWQALRNSVIIATAKLAAGFPFSIVLAIALNEIRIVLVRRVVQTVTMFPFFISWVVAGAMFTNLLSPNCVVNEIIEHVFGLERTIFLADPAKFRWIIVLQDTWKYAGYFAVLYLAAMATIDPALYEAAMVDGANRWQLVRYITIPGITPTMATLFVLLTGYLIYAGFEQVYVMLNASVYETGDILETYTLRLALTQGRYGLAAAIGLFQSVVSLCLVILTNLAVKRFKGQGIF